MLFKFSLSAKDIGMVKRQLVTVSVDCDGEADYSGEISVEYAGALAQQFAESC